MAIAAQLQTSDNKAKIFRVFFIERLYGLAAFPLEAAQPAEADTLLFAAGGE